MLSSIVEVGEYFMGPTKKQAKRENAFIFFIMLAVSIGCIVGHLFIKSDWKYALLFVGVVGIFVSFGELFKGLKKIKRSFCPQCGAYYQYGKDITWEADREEIYKNGNKAYYIATFYCVCPDCGKQIVYKRHGVYADFDKNTNSWKQRDVYAEAKDLFWTE